MRFSLGATVSQVATVIGVAARGVSYLKDSLKVYFDFKSSRAKTLEFVGTGSTYFVTNDYLELADSNTFTFIDSSVDIGFSIAAWIKMDDASDFPIVCKDATSHREWSFSVNPSRELQIFTYDNSASAYIGRKTDTITSHEDKWVHVACTYDGTKANTGFKLYINGIQSDDDNVSSGSYTSMENKDSTLLIGKDQGGDYADGSISQIGVWSRNLSSSEIQNIMYKTYNDLKGTELTHLKAWWGLDGQVGSDGNAGTGYILDEVSGAGSTTNLLTINGATLQDGIYGGYSPRKPRGFDNAPTAQADLIGSGSALFDRSNNDHITIADAANLSSSNHSLVFWIKFDDTTNTYGILNKYDEGTSAQREWRVIMESNDVKFIQYNSASQTSKTAATTTAITAGKWHHYAFTHDGSNLKGYMDGVLEVTTSTGGDHATLNAADRGVLFGTYYNSGSVATTQDFDGNLAQVGWFSSALTQEQIQSIKEKTYSDLSTSEKTNLVSWWGLDSVLLGDNFGETPNASSNWERGQIAEDSQGSLTLIINETFEDTSNWVATGSGVLSMNGDGNMVITASGGTSGARYTPSVTLDSLTYYLVEWSIADGTDTSMYFRNHNTDSAGGTMYGNGYLNGTTSASNTTPKTLSYKFISHSSVLGVHAYLGDIGDTNTGILKSFKLYKINSGNYGVLR